MDCIAAIFLLLIFTQSAYPYGIYSHSAIAEKTVPKSDSNYITYIHDFLGINEKEVYTYLDPEDVKVPSQWYDLIYNGSQREDDEKPFARPLNHFYDPNTNDTLWLMKPLGGRPTVEWALEQTIDDIYYSLDYMINGDYHSYRTFVDENNLYPTDLSVSIQFNCYKGIL